MSDIPSWAGKPAKCSVETYPRGVFPGPVDIEYGVVEFPSPIGPPPNPDPLDIISWDQDVYVLAKVTLPKSIVPHFCASLCIDVDVDTCGPAPDKQFAEQWITVDPKANPSGQYWVWVNLPPGTFAPEAGYPNRCGRVYRICITLGSTDGLGRAGLIWAHCDSLELVVHSPVPNP